MANAHDADEPRDRARRSSATPARPAPTARASRPGTTRGSSRIRRGGRPRRADPARVRARGDLAEPARRPGSAPTARPTSRSIGPLLRGGSLVPRSSTRRCPACPHRGRLRQHHDAPRPARRRSSIPDGERRRHARTSATTAASTRSTSAPARRSATPTGAAAPTTASTRCCPTAPRWRRTARSTPACRTTASCGSSRTAREYKTHDGDGTSSAVDPDDSNVAYERQPEAGSRRLGRRQELDGDDRAVGHVPVRQPVLDGSDRRVAPARRRQPGLGDDDTDGGRWTSVFRPRHVARRTSPTPCRRSTCAASATARRSRPGRTRRTSPTRPATGPPASSGTTGRDVPGYVRTTSRSRSAPNDGDARVDVKITWASSTDDWDLYLYRKDGGKLVRSTARHLQPETGVAEETCRCRTRRPATTSIRVVNSTATGDLRRPGTFTQRDGDHPVAAARHRLRRVLRHLRRAERAAVRQRHRHQRRRPTSRHALTDGWHRAAATASEAVHHVDQERPGGPEAPCTSRSPATRAAGWCRA